MTAGTPDLAYAPAEIQRELEQWSRNLTKAKTDQDILGIDTAQRWINVWLDRYLEQKGA